MFTPASAPAQPAILIPTGPSLPSAGRGSTFLGVMATEIASSGGDSRWVLGTTESGPRAADAGFPSTQILPTGTVPDFRMRGQQSLNPDVATSLARTTVSQGRVLDKLQRGLIALLVNGQLGFVADLAAQSLPPQIVESKNTQVANGEVADEDLAQHHTIDGSGQPVTVLVAVPVFAFVEQTGVGAAAKKIQSETPPDILEHVDEPDRDCASGTLEIATGQTSPEVLRVDESVSNRHASAPAAGILIPDRAYSQLPGSQIPSAALNLPALPAMRLEKYLLDTKQSGTEDLPVVASEVLNVDRRDGNFLVEVGPASGEDQLQQPTFSIRIGFGAATASPIAARQSESLLTRDRSTVDRPLVQLEQKCDASGTTEEGSTISKVDLVAARWVSETFPQGLSGREQSGESQPVLRAMKLEPSGFGGEQPDSGHSDESGHSEDAESPTHKIRRGESAGHSDQSLTAQLPMIAAVSATASQIEDLPIESEGQRWVPRVWEPARFDSGIQRPTTPLRDLDIRLSGDAQPVDIRLRERGGRLDISVRTGDAVLAKQMQSDLVDLVRNLESHGYDATIRKATDTGDGPVGDVRVSEQTPLLRGVGPQRNPNESDSSGGDPPNRQNSQQQPRRNKNRLQRTEPFRIAETTSQGGTH